MSIAHTDGDTGLEAVCLACLTAMCDDVQHVIQLSAFHFPCACQIDDSYDPAHELCSPSILLESLCKRWQSTRSGLMSLRPAWIAVDLWSPDARPHARRSGLSVTPVSCFASAYPYRWRAAFWQ